MLILKLKPEKNVITSISELTKDKNLIDRIIYHATRIHSYEDTIDRNDAKINNVKVFIEALDCAVKENGQEIVIIRETK